MAKAKVKRFQNRSTFRKNVDRNGDGGGSRRRVRVWLAPGSVGTHGRAVNRRRGRLVG